MSNIFDEFYKDIDKKPEYLAASLRMNFAKSIEREMRNGNISQSQLADIMGCSRAYTTKLLRGDANFTMLTMAKIALALDSSVVAYLSSKNSEKYRRQNIYLLKRSLENKEKNSKLSTANCEIFAKRKPSTHAIEYNLNNGYSTDGTTTPAFG